MKLNVLTGEQCEVVRQWRNEVLETLRTPYPLTREMQEVFYRDVICSRNSSHRYWAIRLDETDKRTDLPEEFAAGIDFKALPFVGMGGITNIETVNQIGEISLIIDPILRKKGYGEKAVDLLLDAAFNQLGLNCTFGECYLTPTGSSGFWKKIISKYEMYSTHLPCRKFWQGRFWDSLYFSVHRDNYEKANSGIKVCWELPKT